jgi:phosphoglycolate phosphatase
MIRTVLFDLDGTLLDSEPDFTHIMNRMLEKHGKAVSTGQMRKTVSAGARAMVCLGYGINDQHDDFAECLKRFLDEYEILIPNTTACLYPGIESMLDNLQKAGLSWGIVTNKSSRFTLPLLKQFPPLAAAKAVICADHVKIAKPDPEGLLMACVQCQSTASDCVYVGDHPRDIEAARNAGMPGIAASWGYLPETPPIEKWHANRIIHTAEDLLACLDSL